MGEIQKLRFNTLFKIKAVDNIKKIIKEKYDLEIQDIKNFIDNIERNYNDNEIDEILFEAERYSYKKLMIFSIKDKQIEELTNPVFKEDFINRNNIINMKDKEKIKGLNENIRCTYFTEYDKFFIIKMAQKKEVIVEKQTSLGILEERSYYYDSVKFIIDKEESLVFMFYNDANIIADGDVDNGKAITEKKTALYRMFIDGNNRTLYGYDSSEELNQYVIKFLEEAAEEDKIKDVERHIILIETKDPVESKNNLRSSKKDCRHNKYRLQAIKYALENEEHIVKMLECEISNKIVIVKENEIILNGPFFEMEVINNVCKEIFPEYKLCSREEESSGRNIQYT